jgi:hypothetical protein
MLAAMDLEKSGQLREEMGKPLRAEAQEARQASEIVESFMLSGNRPNG